MKKAIINADDFGLCVGINQGIEHAFTSGILTSATLIANHPGFDDAVRIARLHPDLRTGIHLSLLWGVPVSGAACVPTLVDRNGCFPDSPFVLSLRYASGRLRHTEIDTEFRRQLDRVLGAGLTPSHLDTHKHIHILPGVLDVMMELASQYGIGRIRVPHETSAPPGALATSPGARWKATLIRYLCRDMRNRLQKRGIRSTDHFRGISTMDAMNSATLIRILEHLPDGVTEIMTHPGCADPYVHRYASHVVQRQIELDALTDPHVRDAVERLGIELIGFDQL